MCLVQYHCSEDSKRKALNAKVWYKFIRESAGEDAVFSAVPVKLDRHDNKALNRVYLLPDHTLVIDNFQPSIYKCL